jgi:hypothetical protein
VATLGQSRSESRWPGIIAILVVLVMLEFLPGRLRLMPLWFPYAIAIVLLVPMLGAALTGNAVFAKIERVAIYFFALISVVLVASTLVRLLDVIISPTHDIGGVALLASAIAIWFINVLAFALLYWELDRGGPEMRSSGRDKPPDIWFPQSPTGERQRLSFIDYLFFAYTTSTAFSPTETFPSTARMKVLMMLQSFFSLAIILVIAGRAINILK